MEENVGQNFIANQIQADMANGVYAPPVVTRFPPEPNGFLHIGHAKSIFLNFRLAEYFGGRCHLRFDDTNPEKEEQLYIDAIKEDVRWLGFFWDDHEYYASDCFEQLYQWARQLILAGKAYVDDLSMEQIREYRGTLTEAGRPSPARERSVEENLQLFERMRAGEFANGAKVLRAKIDMASGNLNMRDPVMYRILHASHPRTGDQWPIYPMYDFAHGQCDSIEGITHSICTLEFEAHRPLYNWFLEQLGVHHPRQIEFARLNLSYTVLSKRKLIQLVQEGLVAGWDDPRLPTLMGMRRRGYPPEAIREFCDRLGVGKSDAWIDLSVLEECVRNQLNTKAPRAFAVQRPLKVVITNYPPDQVEELSVPNHPQQPDMGRRSLPFSRELYIEADDFMEDPPKKYFRLAPGREVRLRYAYVIRCDEVVRDTQGQVVELRCSYDPDTLGQAPEGRKVKGIIHWLSCAQAQPARFKVYDRLFKVPNPGADKEVDFRQQLNPESVTSLDGFVEPGLLAAQSEQAYQFERLGYFCRDKADTAEGVVQFNRTVTLRDTWSKVQQKG